MKRNNKNTVWGEIPQTVLRFLKCVLRDPFLPFVTEAETP